jgi:hypothetical protein
MTRVEEIREKAIACAANWWYCDNIISHPDEVGLLKMDFPRAFLLIRDEANAYEHDFDKWCEFVEVNFFTPSEREEANIKSIMIDAWNFLSLCEEEEENQYYINNQCEDDDD